MLNNRHFPLTNLFNFSLSRLCLSPQLLSCKSDMIRRQEPQGPFIITRPPDKAAREVDSCRARGGVFQSLESGSMLQGREGGVGG